MVQISEKVAFAAVVVVVPAIISAAVSPALMHVGRMILPFARTGLLHAGIMGAIQAVVGNILYYKAFHDDKDSSESQVLKYLGAQAIVAAAIIAISFLAIQAGIIASTTTLTGMVILGLANGVLSYGTLMAFGSAIEYAVKNEWIELIDESGDSA